MKKKMLLGLVLAATLSAGAQTWEEWTQQKETQKKYLLEQIAAIQVYLGYARKGYEIAGKGWSLIQGIKEGDLDLHSEFFSSFSKVNPVVKNSPYAAAILTLYSRTQKKIKSALRRADAAGRFTGSEISYCNRVLDRALQDANDALEELRLLTTDHQWELSDDERLKRIEALYQRMQGTYTATATFCQQMDLLSAQRRWQQVETQHVKKINGLK